MTRPRLELWEKEEISFRLIIGGTRDFYRRKLLEQKAELYCLPYNHVIVCVGGSYTEGRGGQIHGADKLAYEWAVREGHSVRVFYADWETHGKAAGPIRNREVAKYAAAGPKGCGALLFWDGESPGTFDMKETAKKFGINVKIVRYKPS